MYVYHIRTVTLYTFSHLNKTYINCLQKREIISETAGSEKHLILTFPKLRPTALLLITRNCDVHVCNLDGTLLFDAHADVHSWVRNKCVR